MVTNGVARDLQWFVEYGFPKEGCQGERTIPEATPTGSGKITQQGYTRSGASDRLRH